MKLELAQFCHQYCFQPFDLTFILSSFITHTSAEGHLGYEKCLQGSVNGFWALFMGYFEYELSPKY